MPFQGSLSQEDRPDGGLLERVSEGQHLQGQGRRLCWNTWGRLLRLALLVWEGLHAGATAQLGLTELIGLRCIWLRRRTRRGALLLASLLRVCSDLCG